MLKPHDRVIAFDKVLWILAGRPENKDPFWMPATVLAVLPPHHDVPEVITIKWDHRGVSNTSHGHRMEDLKKESTNAERK